ncbi:MAG: type III-A CRISPR-associated protein Cas10/Csm1 [Dethiobacter sp.]
MEGEEYQTVILAGLLHDIGKFLQRGAFGSLNVEGRHPEVSARFVAAFGQVFTRVADIDLLKTLVQKHHEDPRFPNELRVDSISDPRTLALALIVSRADSLSSAERGERGRAFRAYKRTPLTSVLERLSLEGKEKRPQANYRPWALTAAKQLSDIFPGDFTLYGEEEINPLLQAFGKEFNKGFKSSVDTKSFDCVITHLLGILQRYTCYVPSNTQEEIPDISLFDHLKTTAAIASCLYQYHAATNTLLKESIAKSDGSRFRLVAGDLSGIQNYIFDIATVGMGGVARRLRARSLSVQMVVEIACHKILRALGLTLANIIMSSGGRFYILLPNTEAAKKVVERIQKEVDDWLLKELNGELALNLASITFGDEGFKTEEKATGFGKVLEQINLKLGERKQHRFEKALVEPDGWQEGEFLREVQFEREGACDSCRKFPQEKKGLCHHCFRDQEMGARLPRAQYIAFYEGPGKGEIPILDNSVSIAADFNKIPPSPHLVLKLNNPISEGEDYRCPMLFKYLATHVPGAKDCTTCEKACSEDRTEERELATFGCLAHQAKGRPLLGFLKADVDNLGALFQFGLKRYPSGKNWDTISRLSTLSRQLDLFFNGWIEHLSQTEFPDCYTVFSGGDDLFFVGPWDSILSFAERIRNDFDRFTQNTEITLSAGIAINKHRHPIARAAPDAEELLEESKHKGRNRLTLLGHTVDWDHWEIVKAQWELLRVRLNEIPSAFLYSLLQYAEMWHEYQKGKTIGLRFQPLLAYNLVRNINSQKSPEVFEWSEKLARLRLDDNTQKVILDNLGLIANLLILEKGGTSDAR